MTKYRDTIWCDGCGVEISWSAVVVDNRHFCCQDCCQGMGCECSYRMELDDERDRKTYEARISEGG